MSAALARPLVMRCGALGDMVLLTVLLAQLHARFASPVDLICAAPWAAALLAGQPWLGEVFVIRSRRTPYWLSGSQQQLVRWLKARGPGPTWFCDLSVGRELLARGGIPDGYICDSRLHPWLPAESFAERFLRLGSLSPPGLPGLPPAVPGIEPAARLAVAPGARTAAGDWLAARGLAGRPFVVLHPGSAHLTRRRLRPRSGSSKYWPEERWVAVAQGVRAHAPDHAILFTGTRPEARLNADIIRASGLADVHNAAGWLPLPQLVAVLERAASMITIDTGPAHIAASLGVPTVALMRGADAAALYRPGGATTPAAALSGAIDGRQSILAITPGMVLSAWIDLQGVRKATTLGKGAGSF